jgi:hypothetical protein
VRAISIFRAGWKEDSAGKSGYFGLSRMEKLEEDAQADEEENELKIELPTTEIECWKGDRNLFRFPRKVISFWLRFVCGGWVCVSEGLPISGRLSVY